MRDLETFLISIMEEPENAGAPKGVRILDSGYWHKGEDFVREGLCTCGQNHCVEAEEKVHCYFHSDLSDWVVGTGLFWKCYDEVINCPRCGDAHIRGHVGRQDYCENPFSNQKHQFD